ncbi:hypothetical protein V6Z12_A08G105900 [Gossypium hirsutum]
MAATSERTGTSGTHITHTPPPVLFHQNFSTWHSSNGFKVSTNSPSLLLLVSPAFLLFQFHFLLLLLLLPFLFLCKCFAFFRSDYDLMIISLFLSCVVR